jgi:hypothetical protein
MKVTARLMTPRPRLECVITCVDYADFLAYTLPTNRHLFDYTVVVTTPDDLATRKLCEFWEVHCVVTDAFRSRGAFAKGAGINAGLEVLSKGGWLVHMDADIFLPPLSRQLIDAAALDPACLYGVDRMMVPDYASWAAFLALPKMQQECRAYIHPTAFPMGVRIYSKDYGGYIPIGFFQMWHPGESGVRSYPDEHTSAGRGDMVFAARWPRSKRGLVPELIAYHLESEPADMGANWQGRRTRPFGPAPAPIVTPPPGAPAPHAYEAAAR